MCQQARPTERAALSGHFSNCRQRIRPRASTNPNKHSSNATEEKQLNQDTQSSTILSARPESSTKTSSHCQRDSPQRAIPHAPLCRLSGTTDSGIHPTGGREVSVGCAARPARRAHLQTQIKRKRIVVELCCRHQRARSRSQAD